MNAPPPSGSPAAPRPDDPRPDPRLVELETKLAFLERTVDDLNEVVIDQGRSIQRLEDHIARLEGRLEGEGDPGQAPMPGAGVDPDRPADPDRPPGTDRADLLAERPPHY